MIPTPRFAIGDKVWDVSIHIESGQHDCPDCFGSRQWTAVSTAGETFAINCLRCAQSYAGLPRDVPPLAYQKSVYTTRELTIGSVRVDTAASHGDPVSYMCEETGIGSGRVYNESKLFTSEEEARASAEIQTQLEQRRLDVGSLNPIRAEAAKWTLSAAMPRVWQEEIYHAWDRYRDLADMLSDLTENDNYDLTSAARELIGEALESRPWRRPQPVGELIDAVKAFLNERTDTNRDRLRQALTACTPPELRMSEVLP